MNVRDVAWVAGIIEGEGTIDSANGLVRVRVAMTDLDILQRLATITGVGRINGPYSNERNDSSIRKPIYCWKVARQDDATALLMTIFPFLGDRRSAKAAETLAMWRARPLNTRRRAA